MSGPKDYTPPPRYSMQVFDGKLNQVFQLQSRLKMLCSEIDGLRVTDPALAIHFDCRQQLAALKALNEAALNPPVFDYKGSFGQEVYNRVSSEIELKISALQRQLSLCESITSEFAGRKADYESYLSYATFYDNSKISFDDFKGRITRYLKNNLASNAPDILEEAAVRLEAVEFEKGMSAFEFGFAARFDSEKQSVVDHVAAKECEVNRVRAETSDRVLDRLKATGAASSQTAAPSSGIPEDAAAVIEKIRSLIRQCDDATAKRTYGDNLQRLTESESLRDIYFYKELHDSILETEKTRRVKIEVNKLLSKLNGTTFHRTTSDEKHNLIRLCLNSLNGAVATTHELDTIRLKLDQLKRSSNERFEDDLIRQKEHLFLKSQVVLCLENLGYEVMDDLEVIDFEKETDFLLKIRGQENYLNLKFKEDGSMRYVFQIPEEQSELSTDQMNSKLHEMKVTCDEFQSVLRDLSVMGLDVRLKSERPIEADSLVTVPESKRDKLRAKSRSRRDRQQVRKKYLTATG